MCCIDRLNAQAKAALRNPLVYEECCESGKRNLRQGNFRARKLLGHRGACTAKTDPEQSQPPTAIHPDDSAGADPLKPTATTSSGGG